MEYKDLTEQEKMSSIPEIRGLKRDRSDLSGAFYFQWFDCVTRLPDLGEVVWLHLAGGSIIIGARDDDGDGWLLGNSYGAFWHNGEKWDADIETDDDYAVTHWMPLPTPPPIS